jgi:uncharacterized ion transporter superfamily protein YfcC
MIEASTLIFFIFFVGASITVVDKTDVLKQVGIWLVPLLQSKKPLIIPITSLIFALGGVLINLEEEIIPLIPIILILTRMWGYDPLTAVAMSLGAAIVGGAFSPINPFQVGIAQKLVGVDILSGALFRIIFLLLALGIWILGTMRHARRSTTSAEVTPCPITERSKLGLRHIAILTLVFSTFAAFIFGVMRFNWGFEQISALFFLMGILVGLLGGLGVEGTAEAFVEGFKSMAYSALLVGFAQAIRVVLEQGSVIDTIVYTLFSIFTQLPKPVSALGIMILQFFIHFLVPSSSSQAILTFPLLIPVLDLIGISRQIGVLTFQYGAGLCNLLTPTNWALMGALGVSQIRYEQWLKFITPLLLSLIGLSMGAVMIAIFINLT